jgi:hypothetical protein
VGLRPPADELAAAAGSLSSASGDFGAGAKLVESGEATGRAGLAETTEKHERGVAAARRRTAAA